MLDLEKLATRNAAILQNAMDGFFVLGEDYRFLEVNAAFCHMVGYTVEELLGDLPRGSLQRSLGKGRRRRAQIQRGPAEKL